MAVATSSLSTTLRGEASGHHPIEEGLLKLLEQLALAGKLISREVARVALTGGLGTTGDKNPTGDSQKNSTLSPTRSVSTHWPKPARSPP